MSCDRAWQSSPDPCEVLAQMLQEDPLFSGKETWCGSLSGCFSFLTSLADAFPSEELCGLTKWIVSRFFIHQGHTKDKIDAADPMFHFDVITEDE